MPCTRRADGSNVRARPNLGLPPGCCLAGPGCRCVLDRWLCLGQPALLAHGSGSGSGLRGVPVGHGLAVEAGKRRLQRQRTGKLFSAYRAGGVSGLARLSPCAAVPEGARPGTAKGWTCIGRSIMPVLLRTIIGCKPVFAAIVLLRRASCGTSPERPEHDIFPAPRTRFRLFAWIRSHPG